MTPAGTNPFSWRVVSGVARTPALATTGQLRARTSCRDTPVCLWLLPPCSQLASTALPPDDTLGEDCSRHSGRRPSSVDGAEQQTRLWLLLTPLVAEAYAWGVRP